MSDVIPFCVQQQQQQQQQRHQQVCVQLPTPADNATLLAFAAKRRAAAALGGRCDRSMTPARRAHSSKPAAAACGGQMMGLTAWNSLPDFIRNPTSSTDCFRRLLKTYLFARY